jgi:hypothetical protein
MLEGSCDAAVSFQARFNKNSTCSSKIFGSVGSVDSLVAPALFCVSLQPTGQPGISSIQELTHVMTVLSFTLKHGTLEDVDVTAIDIFDTRLTGKEHVDW